MYTRYAEARGFAVEILSGSETRTAATRRLSLEAHRQGAYSALKYESGVHRVQRVPATEGAGRIHTSTATVAVLPEVEEVEIEILANDLQIDVFRARGPGGQSVNTTDSAVRITHLPTGVVVSARTRSPSPRTRSTLCGCSAPGCTSRAGPADAERRDDRRGRSVPAIARRRSAPTTSRSRGSATIASGSPAIASRRCSRGISTSSPRHWRPRTGANSWPPRAGTDAMNVADALRAAAQRLRAGGALLAASRRRVAPGGGARRRPCGPLQVAGAPPSFWPTRPSASLSSYDAGKPFSRSPTSAASVRTIDLEVTFAVLIPRPATETLVDVALELLAEVDGRGAPEPLRPERGHGLGVHRFGAGRREPVRPRRCRQRGRRRAEGGASQRGTPGPRGPCRHPPQRSPRRCA